ncbi:MAG TPA: hypothetical protein VN797_07070 [Gemmatimonadaceae bacterium]|nr:hypothetical protein [Gemmatimonadaceae bacterium]
MHESAVSIATRKLELSQTKYRVFRLWSKWIIHDNVPVVALGVRGVGRQ